jgi:NAD-dependent SIR2 family protein deacetylase
MALEDKLIKSIKEYTYADFHEVSCGQDYYECNMCGATIKWERSMKELSNRNILDMIPHHDDCPYELVRKS